MSAARAAAPRPCGASASEQVPECQPQRRAGGGREGQQRVQHRPRGGAGREGGLAVEQPGREYRRQVEDPLADRNAAARRLPGAAEHAIGQVLQRKVATRVGALDPAPPGGIVAAVQVRQRRTYAVWPSTGCGR